MSAAAHFSAASARFAEAVAAGNHSEAERQQREIARYDPKRMLDDVKVPLLAAFPLRYLLGASESGGNNTICLPTLCACSFRFLLVAFSFLACGTSQLGPTAARCWR